MRPRYRGHNICRSKISRSKRKSPTGKALFFPAFTNQFFVFGVQLYFVKVTRPISYPLSRWRERVGKSVDCPTIPRKQRWKTWALSANYSAEADRCIPLIAVTQEADREPDLGDTEREQCSPLPSWAIAQTRRSCRSIWFGN